MSCTQKADMSYFYGSDDMFDLNKKDGQRKKGQTITVHSEKYLSTNAGSKHVMTKPLIES